MLYSLAYEAIPFDWTIIFGWFGQLWDLLNRTLIRGFGLSVSIADIALGGIVTLMIVSVFWKGARA